MKFLWCLLVLGLLAAVSEAKRKRKFEGDFEFADEDESRSKAGDKKRWIHDPNSDLCHPLNCKKKELCLLEDDFTAVCVSKKELHKNGDVVISKAKLLAEEEEARRRAALEDDADADDDDDDDVFYDTEDDPDDQEDDSGETVSCKSCPVTKPTFLCGSNNRTFSSLCRLDYHNCIHQTNIRVACKGFCPCKESDMHLRKKQRQAERYMNKYKSVEKKSGVDTSPRQDRYTFTPEDFKYENKHYKYIKYTKFNKDGYNKLNNPIYSEDKERQRGYNDVLDTKPSQRSSSSQSNKSTCPPASLQAMANRLLDWFSVIMADTNKRRSRTHPKYKSAYFPSGCKSEVRWMFGHLDSDADGRLSMQELYDLEHDRNEPCIRPFLQQCTAGSNGGGSSTSSASANQQVTPRDWCHCFDHADRPCAAVKRRITPELMGVYVPDCDSQGYYRSTQCHSAIGMCWCVDKHGVEYANTRTRGKPNCDTLVAKSASSVQQTNENNTDDEDGDDVEQEGSADQPLDF